MHSQGHEQEEPALDPGIVIEPAACLVHLMQLQHKSLRAITATRPGGTEHVTIAIIHAVDTAGARQACCCQVQLSTTSSIT